MKLFQKPHPQTDATHLGLTMRAKYQTTRCCSLQIQKRTLNKQAKLF